MKQIFENVIAKGTYDLSDMLKKIDTYHISGQLTDEEKDELYNKARNGATAQSGVDVFAKLEELDKRIKALEDGTTTMPNEEYAEYVIGKWYYNGNKIISDGKKYTCAAPDGVVCTWSPKEYPAYWQYDGEA